MNLIVEPQGDVGGIWLGSLEAAGTRIKNENSRCPSLEKTSNWSRVVSLPSGDSPHSEAPTSIPLDILRGGYRDFRYFKTFR